MVGMRLAMWILLAAMLAGPGVALAGSSDVKLACTVGDGTKAVTENKAVTKVGYVWGKASVSGMEKPKTLAAACNEKYPADCNGQCWACKQFDERWLGMSNMGCYDLEGACHGWCGPPY
ncbi:MAG: hypothetical protein H0S85_10220 [Desulfovibrionaceae bacterium]|jgi:hypothetical protein|nr:hypothetical protein [Desulfovibrionaceae bacterium]